MNSYKITLDDRIADLKPSESIVIGYGFGIICTAERSSKGNTIKFVRTYPNGSWKVYKTSKI